jgi:hypothetical protein
VAGVSVCPVRPANGTRRQTYNQTDPRIPAHNHDQRFVRFGRVDDRQQQIATAFEVGPGLPGAAGRPGVLRPADGIPDAAGTPAW